MERYIEPNEKLILVECIEEDWGFKVGELCWAVTEYNSTYDRVFYKVIDNVRHIFLYLALYGSNSISVIIPVIRDTIMYRS